MLVEEGMDIDVVYADLSFDNLLSGQFRTKLVIEEKPLDHSSYEDPSRQKIFRLFSIFGSIVT